MSDFIHSDLVQRRRGDIVEVTLKSKAANVRLLDSMNFSRYRKGQQHRYVCALAKSSRVRLPIPTTGHWHASQE